MPARTEFGRGLVYEGSMIEWWGRSLNEEMFGHWSKRWRQALLEKYNFKDSDLHYFQVHEEADLHEHEDGLMAHGEVARKVFETLLQDGLTWFRSRLESEYCCPLTPTTWRCSTMESINIQKNWAIFERKEAHHEDREGHEDQIAEKELNLKKMVSSFVLFVVLRGDPKLTTQLTRPCQRSTSD